MAEAVGSAVIGEAVNRAVTALLAKPETLERNECVERLEMAHIRMEAAVEASNRWKITDVPLLRWRRTLKRAAQECDDTLRSCKQLALEDEARARQLRRSYLPTRIAHATKSFISSLILGSGATDGDQSSSSTVRRFERYADGAEEFLRFGHLGGTTPLRPYAFSNPLVGQLLAGEFLGYEMLTGSQYRHFAVQAVYSPDRGVEAQVNLVYADTMAPMENFYFCIFLRLQESVDIIGTGAKTLLSAASRYKPGTVDAVIKELTQLPTQDFHWSPSATFFHQESDNLHREFVQRFRPDPFCCKDHGSSVFPEPVIGFFLQRHVSLSHEHNPSDLLPLKLQTYISPHDSPIDLQPAYECSAIELIDGKEHPDVHVNIGLDTLDEVFLPKAKDYLYGRIDATTYQVLWNSKHGTAQIFLEKTGAQTQMKDAGKRSKSAFQPQEYLMKTLKQSLQDTLKLRVVHQSVRLRDAMLAWIREVDPGNKARRGGRHLKSGAVFDIKFT